MCLGVRQTADGINLEESWGPSDPFPGDTGKPFQNYRSLSPGASDSWVPSPIRPGGEDHTGAARCHFDVVLIFPSGCSIYSLNRLIAPRFARAPLSVGRRLADPTPGLQ